ncbi:MAG: tol-pal system protein YbgF [Alteromonadaceae bacterium]|nr:tol-pal system protein YbgF [Alteromonadaceae bacterium]MBH86124.1 tol-pal system protein YbgF [Alteromonadaceae bacterium]|tara:strand:- start:324 stop:1094 length:771 start_codon:yes stop_codon:yes gene_type:complete
MRQILMATVALSLCGSALAQSTVPAYQNAGSQARTQSASGQGNAELFFMIEQLQQEVRKLNGVVEEQKHKLDRLTRQSKERYIDLDQRILELSRNQPATDSSGASASGAVAETSKSGGSKGTTKMREYRAPSDKERAAYDEIQTLIREKKDYDGAIDRIYSFISEYPEGDLTVNAYYWLGEVYLVKPQLEQAKQAFSIVASRFGDHRKAPDALYKLGVTEDRLGDKAAARKTLESVSERYGDSNASKLASEYLTKL